MNVVIDNWMIAVAALAILLMAGLYAMKWIQLPNAKQQEMIKHWLLWAVIETEKKLGSGTGQLKLITVYNMFIEKFPGASAVLSFEKFSAMVDVALEEMHSMISSNEIIKQNIKNRN